MSVKVQRRTAIYARLSRNRTGEPSASTRNQVAACEKLAAERGYDVAMVEIDDDRSAYSGKRRPGYERILEAIETGSVDAVLAWAPDRLHRSPVELESFIDLVEAHGVEVATVQAGRVDLASPAGRMQARMLGTIARYESEHRSERIKLAHDALAADGRWKGGRRPYGYAPVDGRKGELQVVPAEAAIITELAERVLAGERVGSLVNDLNRREVPTSTGSRWSIPTMRAMLTSPTIAGRRVSKGEDVGPAQWPAILDGDTAHQVRSILQSGPKRGRVPRVALLSGGRCVCKACTAPMRTARKTGAVRIYRCSECFRQAVAEPLEAHVADQLLWRLDRAEIPDAPPRRRPPERTLEQLEDDLAQLAEDLGDGTLTRAEWLAARKPLLARIEAARSELQSDEGMAPLAPLAGRGGASARWPSLTLEQRQAALDVLVERVVVAPATRRGRGFDTGRVEVVWRA